MDVQETGWNNCVCPAWTKKANEGKHFWKTVTWKKTKINSEALNGLPHLKQEISASPKVQQRSPSLSRF